MGQVEIKGGRFKLKGDFHRTSHSEPIRNVDENGRLMGVTGPRGITHIHMYGGEAVFFENLGRGKIFGSRCETADCESAGSVYLPFRIHCPDCLGRNMPVDLTEVCRNSARIHSFMVCRRSGAFNLLDKPIRFINLAFDGVCTILMSYLSAGEPDIGRRVTPIFKTANPTYTILDLSWVPTGTASDRLPPGFSFC